MISSDGGSWTTINTGMTQYINFITFDGNQFVACGGSGMILTSPDGANWTQQKSGTSTSLSSIAYGTPNGDGQFVAVGESGTILTSKVETAGVHPAFPPTRSSKIHFVKSNKNILFLLPDLAKGQTAIAVFNVAGKKIYSARARTGSMRAAIPVAGFSPGVYYLSVTNERGGKSTASFIIE
jgi:hypothetical protein